VARQELADRAQHFFRFFGVIPVGNVLAHGRACPRRQRRLHGQYRVVVLVAELLVMRGQVGQHFLGVFAAVDGQQDFHESLLIRGWGLCMNVPV